MRSDGRRGITGSPPASVKPRRLGGVGSEFVGDHMDAVGRESAAASVFTDGAFVVGLVQAVDLVAGDIAGDPAVRHAERLDDAVRLARNRRQLLPAEVTGSGYFP